MLEFLNDLLMLAFFRFLQVGLYEQYDSARFLAFLIIDSAQDLL